MSKRTQPRPSHARVKVRPIEVDATNAYANDLLDRKASIERLTEYLCRVPTPYTMAVDAAWGMGKTSFLAMWAPVLEGRGIKVVTFNAWEADYSAEPLSPVIAKFRAIFPRRKAAITQKAKKVLKGIAGAALPGLVRAATVGAIDIKSNDVEAALADAVESAVERGIESFTQRHKEISDLRAELAGAAAEEGGELARVVVLIDELDRCRPPFAVELLERIKHILEVEGFVFVLALDRAQLAHSVRAVYGASFDGEGYLGRFFDVAYRLPLGDRRRFATEVLSRRLGWGAIVGERGTADERSFAAEFFAMFCDFLELSPREVEQCAGRLAATIYTVPSKNYLQPGAKVVLSVISQVKPGLYRELVTSREGADRALEALELERRALEAPRDSFWLAWVAANLLVVPQELFDHSSARVAEYRQRRETWQKASKVESQQPGGARKEPPPEVGFAIEVLQLLENRGFNRPGWGVKNAVEALDFVRNFDFGSEDDGAKGEGSG